MRLSSERFVSLKSLLMPALCGAWLAAAPVLADADNPPPPRGDHPPGGGEGRGHKPPTAAYTACKDLSADDVCTVTFGEHTIEGTCEEDSDSALFCKPDQPPGPPPEAAEACTDKSAGDACTVTFSDGKEGPSGSCVTGKDDTLFCRPSGMKH